LSCTIDGYRIDVAEAEEHAFNAAITEHPLENGAVVSDHVRDTPIAVTIQGIVSDTPIGTLADERNALSLPSQEIYDKLLELRAKKEPITIETSLGTFANMVLQSLNVPRSISTGEAFKFRAAFQQIQLVTNERTRIKVAVPRAAKKEHKGNKASPETGTDDVPAAPEQERSWAMQGANWIHNKTGFSLD
jgi:hypothetical protein